MLLDAIIVDVDAVHRIEILDNQCALAVQRELAMVAADRVMFDAKPRIRIAAYDDGRMERPTAGAETVNFVL